MPDHPGIKSGELFVAGEYPCRYDIATDIAVILSKYVNTTTPTTHDTMSFIDEMRSLLDQLASVEAELSGRGWTKCKKTPTIQEAAEAARESYNVLNTQINRIIAFMRRNREKLAAIRSETDVAHGARGKTETLYKKKMALGNKINHMSRLAKQGNLTIAPRGGLIF